jgi:hypothetical protein
MNEATGRCLCGAVRYRVRGRLRPVIACHCVQCRRTSGHHAAATAAKLSDVEIEGTPAWFESSSGFRRGFCATCGSNLFWRDEATDRLSIFAGALDMPTDLRLAGHIFVDQRGDYYDITDGLPQAPGNHDAPGFAVE